MASKKKKAKKRRVYKGVRPRPDCGGRYEIQWMVRDPVTGKMKRRRELLQTTNEGEAILQRAQRIRAEEAAAPEPIANITLNDFAERYLASHKHQKDYVSKRQRLMNYILPALGDRPIVSISVYEYEQFRRSVVGECATTAERLKREKTANRYMSLIKHMVRWGVEQLELVPEEALTRVRRSKQAKEAPGRLVFFYLSDAVELVSRCSAPEDMDLETGFLRATVLLGFGTGIRRGDLLKLRWKDVDTRAGTIYVGGDSGADTKGGAGYHVEIGGIARFGLEEARAWLQVNGKPARPNNYVIDWRSRDRVLKLFQPAYVEARGAAGLAKELTFHCTRHSYGTWALAHGENPMNVRDWMGHQNFSTTQRYAHAVPRKKALVDTVNPLAEDSDKPFRQACGQGVENVVHLRKKAQEGTEEAVSGGERASAEIAPSRGERGVGMRRWREHRPHGHRRTGSDPTSDEP